MLAPDDGIVLYRLDLTWHIARAGKRDSAARGAMYVPMQERSDTVLHRYLAMHASKFAA
jgi:hypothetical protein